MHRICEQITNVIHAGIFQAFDCAVLKYIQNSETDYKAWRMIEMQKCTDSSLHQPL
jgi:hypothetical protein